MAVKEKEITVTYTFKEVIDKIDAKFDSIDHKLDILNANKISSKTLIWVIAISGFFVTLLSLLSKIKF